MKVKVISLLQPWASLAAAGHKKIETRSWNTKYRGEIYIHASAGWSRLQNELSCSDPFYNKLLELGFIGGKAAHKCGLPLGAIIGKANLVDTIESDIVNHPKTSGISIKFNHWQFTEQELAFGDYSPGRYGWLLSDPVLFEKPIPAKGKLGIWEFEMPENFNL